MSVLVPVTLYMVVGLGNPGERYAFSRHNIGFMAIDAVATLYHFPPFKISFSAALSEGTIGGHKVLLCKPLTYMNLSGQPVGDVLRFYKVPPKHVYVIHDDLDLAPGKIKLKLGGGSGGHNGLGSLDRSIGKDYWRVRLGIGHPGRSPTDSDGVTRYVLGNFPKGDKKWLQGTLSTVAAEAESLFGADPGVWLTKAAQRRC